MTKYFFGLILMGLAVGCGKGFDKEKPKQQRSQNAQEVDTHSMSQEFLELVNDHRISLRLRPLTYHQIIEDTARLHSKGMALHSRPFGHLGFNQRCRQLRRRVGRHTQCAEIVAAGQKNAKAVLAAWLSSPQHRREIENPDYTLTGLGIYKSEAGVTYWTQMFLEL